MNQQVDLSYYKPVNKEQAEFHASRAKHKLLLGGVGSGKTYPALHECIFNCIDNPGHNSMVLRNTWDSVKDNIELEMVDVLKDAGLLKDYNKTDHHVVLINGHNIFFRPLTLSMKILKGFYLCQFYIDDPDVAKYEGTIQFLFTRLRDRARTSVKAKKFSSIFTANWEGRDYLWKIFMKDREPGGDGKFAYWNISTEKNPTLPEDYIETLAETHSQDWMDRYVHSKMNSNIGLIFYMLDERLHHMPFAKIPRDLTYKILTIDVGLGVTASYKMATDRKNIYVWGENYAKGWESGDLGLFLKDLTHKERFNRVKIDPSSAKKEQTSGTSVLSDLRRNYGINLEGADNDVTAGIRAMKDLLKPAVGKPRLFIDFRQCPKLIDEMSTYRWKEPRDINYDEVGYKEEPVKKNDHGCDAVRYGVQELKRYLLSYAVVNSGKDALALHQQLQKTRRAGLKLYQEHPDERDALDPRAERGRLNNKKEKSRKLLRGRGNSRKGKIKPGMGLGVLR